MFRIIFTFVFFFSLLTGIRAQMSHIDSLENRLKTMTDEKEKTKLLTRIAKEWCFRDYNKALQYANMAVVSAEKAKYDVGLANAYNMQGIIWINLGENDKAITSLDSALKWQTRSGNKVGIASVNGNLAVLYYQLGNYKRSLECNYECLKAYEDLKNKEGIAVTLCNIANIDFMQGEYEKAGQGYKQALGIYTEIDNRFGQANAMLNIAMVYEKMKRPDEAEKLFTRVMIVYDSLKNDEGLATVCMNLGGMLKNRGDNEKALSMLLKALALFEKVGTGSKYTEALGMIGSIYQKNGDYEKSIEYNEKFLKEAGKMKARPYQKDAMESLAEAYASMGNFARAYGYQMLLSRIKDTLYNEERLTQVANMKVKYETEKKEQENQTLQQKARIYDLQLSLLFGSAVLLLLVASFALLYLRQNKLAAKQKTVELEQKVLRSQMNPHFIFNSLIAIQSFIYRNDPKTAGDYLSDFAKLMRLILEYSREEMIPLEKEIKTLELYLKLQQLRFDNSFDFKIEVDDSISNSSVAIPPMLAQPFIENSVEHGISKIDRHGMINVRFAQQDDFLKIIVSDNGVGITKAMETKKDKGHKSLATTITQERLEILNRGSKKKISLAVGDIKNADGSIGGTRIEFGLPFKRL